MEINTIMYTYYIIFFLTCFYKEFCLFRQTITIIWYKRIYKIAVNCNVR